MKRAPYSGLGCRIIFWMDCHEALPPIKNSRSLDLTGEHGLVESSSQMRRILPRASERPHMERPNNITTRNLMFAGKETDQMDSSFAGRKKITHMAQKYDTTESIPLPFPDQDLPNHNQPQACARAQIYLSKPDFSIELQICIFNYQFKLVHLNITQFSHV